MQIDIPVLGRAASVGDARAVLRAICDACAGMRANPFRRTSDG